MEPKKFAPDPKKLIADMLTQASRFYANTGPVVLDEFQRKALNAAMAGKNILVTGQAGSGKSVLMREINKLSCEQGVVCNNVAHNGIAAANINGLTINAFAGLGMQFHAPYNAKKINAEAKARIKVTQRLIIDEISTTSNHMFDGLDVLFREITGNLDVPFGGIQIIACGDFAQLKPVDDSSKRDEMKADMKRHGQTIVDKNEEIYAKMSSALQECLTKPSDPIDFCWLSKAWKYFKDNIYLLKTPYRQGACPVYRKILSEARIGELSNESHRLLEAKAARGKYMQIPDDYTMLLSYRKDVADYNQKRLARLPPAKGRTFKAVDHADNDYYRKLLANIPLLDTLELRQGCRVLLKRNTTRELVNGSCGTVVGWTCHPSADSTRVSRPTHGLVFANPSCVRSSSDIVPFTKLELPQGAEPVALSFTSTTVIPLERQKYYAEMGYANKDELEANLFASNGLLPLPVICFDNGEYVVATPTKWAIEINRREEIADDETEQPTHTGANGGTVSIDEMRKLARITAAQGGARSAGARKEKKYRTVPHEVAFRIQIPLQLSYAISVHASQGITVEKLAVDLGRTIFDKGQAYVALSRGTMFDKLIVTDYIRSKIMADPRVIKFYCALEARAAAENAKPSEIEADTRQDSELSEAELFKRLMDRRRKTSLAKALEI